jgi:hypothetical protein
MPSVLKLIVAVFFLSILPVLGYALTPDQVFDKVKDSIVVVKTLDAQGKVKGQGSGHKLGHKLHKLGTAPYFHT